MLLKHRDEIAFAYTAFFERFTFEKIEYYHKGSEEESDLFWKSYSNAAPFLYSDSPRQAEIRLIQFNPRKHFKTSPLPQTTRKYKTTQDHLFPIYYNLQRPIYMVGQAVFDIYTLLIY